MGTKINNNVTSDPKTEETKVEETKTEETKTEETKVEETKTEETKVEETKTEETKVEETKTEETTKKAGKKYRALVSFCGQITMSKGSEREINNKELAKDLLKAGYIEEVK